MKRRAAAVGVGVVLLTVCGTGCGTGEPRSAASRSAAAPITVADTGSPAGTTLAAIYRAALLRGGTDAVVVPTRDLSDALAALDDTRVSLLPAFSGAALALLNSSSDARTAEDVHEALARSLPDWLTVSDAATAADDVVVRTSAPVTGAATLSAFAPACAGLTVTVPGEAGEGILSTLDDVYGCRFAGTVDRGGDVTIGRAVTAALPTGESGTGTTLSDDRAAFAAQEVAPLVRKGALDDAAAAALETVAGELTTADLATATRRVDAGEPADVVAQQWVDEVGGH